MGVKLGFLVTLEAKDGKGEELGEFLRAGREFAAAEEETVTWYAFRIDATHYGIFDTFASENGRQAHIAGPWPRRSARPPTSHAILCSVSGGEENGGLTLWVKVIRRRTFKAWHRSEAGMLRIGIDLGGTKIEGIALAPGGKERARRRVATSRGDYGGDHRRHCRPRGLARTCR